MCASEAEVNDSFPGCMYGDARYESRPGATIGSSACQRPHRQKGTNMNHPSTPPTRHNTPAIFIIAAVVLILFCGVGIAALMGWLPSSEHSGRPGQLLTPPSEQVSAAPRSPDTTATQSSQYAAGAPRPGGAPRTTPHTHGRGPVGSTRRSAPA
jgi:hypothetical protein